MAPDEEAPVELKEKKKKKMGGKAIESLFAALEEDGGCPPGGCHNFLSPLNRLNRLNHI